MVVGVLVELSSKNIDKVFDYAVSEELQDKIKVGIRVEVPFGRQKLEGFVLEIKKSSNLELKEIIDIVDEEPVLNEELLFLGKEMQKKTLSTLISCYQVMLPKALKAKRGTVINKKYDTFYKLNSKNVNNCKLNATQQEIVDMFKTRDKIKRKELVEISGSSLKTLVKHGVLEEEVLEHYRVNYNDGVVDKKVLTTDQEKVVKEIPIEGGSEVYLIHGVTGSGKTEVYMELIDKVLSAGKTAIMLVPEISLTPQMVERFERRFGNKIAAIHSALSDGEKYDEYRRIVRGEASIVIGARSAIFAPLKNIGIIIIDEEHSDSYKQEDPNPRYHALDIAITRGKYYNCPVVLGSATPSLDTYARAKKGVYKLLSLPKRINNKELPKVNIVDMHKEIRNCKGYFSNILISAIEKRINNKEQVILLLNRRGYSSFISCKNCGHVFKCPHCDITLTYHKSSNNLRCHYCGYGEKRYVVCPECGEKALTDMGTGTEKIEEQLQSIFPDSRIMRMDYDTTSKKGMHEVMIKSFQNKEFDILLGTQIVAKGLDFDNVTLVGVINADTSLAIPDFRSSENTFTLLSQVAGRSGRNEKEGEVIIQTYNPDHYAIQFSKNHDYLGFYNKEMEIRRMLKYPPYYYICYIKISGKDSNYIFNESLKIKRSLDRNLNNFIILGPTSCNVFKVNNTFRYGIIIKYKKLDNLNDILEKIIDHYKGNNKIKIDIDFNPNHF